MATETDLALAKALLTKQGVQFVLVKGGQILFQGQGSGVRPLMEALDQLGDAARGASLADRIAGKAVAVLACQAGLSALHAVCLSVAAREVLESEGILVTWDELVPAIRNRNGTGLCPLEQLLLPIADVGEAAAALRQRLRAALPT